MYSYPTLIGEVDLNVVSVAIDGQDLPYSRISRPEQTIALHEVERTNWETAQLTLKAAMPERELAEGAWTDVSCLAVLTENATNARNASILHRGPAGEWTGSIELSHARYVRRATLELLVTATIDGIGGRIIGSTDQNWFVDLTSSKPARQRDVDIVEEDFHNGPLAWLKPYRESAWIVDTSADIPRVYLNTTAAEGLVDLLNSSGGSSEAKLLREMAASQIAQDAWTAMFHSAVSNLDTDEDGTPQMPGGWRDAVLKTMLPDVIPDRQLTDALYEIGRQRHDGVGWSEIQTRIQYAAGRRSRLTRKLTAAVRSVHHTESKG
ncbi:hypothetical protein [Prescottella subtropica]|uniref:hypothetical protein n=1 Tax=Prescottella subtropica TaxID=2545757 RepID=UPI0019D6A717|nr:hypothetical protein [Prescottella subtropica]